jgi:hypothetical protein
LKERYWAKKGKFGMERGRSVAMDDFEIMEGIRADEVVTVAVLCCF